MNLVNFFKLLINCVYVKSMENIRKRINVKLVNDSKTYLKCVSKPNFKLQKIFDKNFVAFHQIKTVLTLNKPIYLGFCILELSKLLMYKFHYDYACNNFNARLLFTDTDSLFYEINGDNVYEQCFKDKDLFDFIGYPKDSDYYDISNKKVLGKMKGELNDVKIVEFVGLRHNEYIDVLFDKKVVRHSMKRIQSKLHEIGTYDVFKISLSCFDDKRYVLDDGINTLAYFHNEIVSS